jgi:aspartyl-tRNA(Asn)/glutamyl-tRNA(Gln) amidotransferase subunit C
MPLGPDQLDHLALLSRLALSDDEKRLFRDQLGRIVEAVEALRELDLDDVKPLRHGVALEGGLRPDVPTPCLSREDALAGAPARTDEGYAVPRVIGEGA